MLRERKQSISRRDRIADSAEKLFCTRGYYGASVRDITNDAGVNVGLVNYYFKTKEDLFRYVVLRRHDQLHDFVRISLDQAVDSAAPGLPTTRALIRAFIAPFIALLRNEDPGWAYYIKLISHVLTLYHVAALRETMASLNDISELFIERLRLVHPTMDDKSFYAALYAIEAVMGFMVQDPGFLDNLTLNHYHSAEMDKLLDHLVPFLAGGVEATSRPE